MVSILVSIWIRQFVSLYLLIGLSIRVHPLRKSVSLHRFLDLGLLLCHMGPSFSCFCWSLPTVSTCSHSLFAISTYLCMPIYHVMRTYYWPFTGNPLNFLSLIIPSYFFYVVSGSDSLYLGFILTILGGASKLLVFLN